MTLRFWQTLRRRSPTPNASSTSSIPVSSAIAGVSTPEWIDRLIRAADNFSLAAEIAAFIVVAGVLTEDWDRLAILVYRPSWAALRSALGPIMVAEGIALEILFSNRSSSKERKVRDWYSLRIAELNLQAEQAHRDNLQLEDRIVKANEEIVKARVRSFFFS